jgi:hypothetical protein
MADLAGYRFLPWVRSGLAASLSQDDTLDEETPGRARLEVAVRLSNTSGGPVDLSRTLTVLGPGDVVGLDPRQVIRMDPPAGSTDAEPNYLVQVELDRPDLPWLFTPAAANAGQQLRPWLVLVVVEEEGPGVTLTPQGPGGLPVLKLTVDAEPARQLPRLDQSWAWAHGQVLLLPGETVDDVLQAVPHRNAARLLCPRRLDPSTRYLACIVPAFEAGRLAGLGLPPEAADEAALRPAWPRNVTAIDLPVYHSWRFATGGGGDFEQLARQLRPRPLPATAGLQAVYVGAAGEPLPETGPDQPGGTVHLAGALVAPGVTAPGWPTETRDQVEQGLTAILNAAAARTSLEGQLDGDPVVGPPLYGQWLAASRTTPTPGAEPAWLRELNLDPRHRAVAGVAATAVAADQEALMDQAWAQIGAVEQANRELRWGQLARAVRASLLRRHLRPLEAGDVLGVTSAAHRRVRVGGRSVAAAVAGSALPDAVVTPAFRRTVAPGGPLARRLDPSGQRAPRPIASRLDAAALTLGAGSGPPDGLFRFAMTTPARADVPADIRTQITEARTAAARGRPRALTPGEFSRVVVTPAARTQIARILGLPEARFGTFRDALGARVTREDALAGIPADPPRPALGVAALATQLLRRLAPETTVAARLEARLKVVAGNVRRQRGTDPLRDVLAAPVFPRPAWQYVRDQAPGLLLPGLQALPQDSVTLAETNPAFAEAFLTGLNHELARELLWREYPTDQRGSCFRRFWGPGDADDIAAQHTWTTGALGDHTVAAADTRVVLVLRGRLLFRYPHTVVYAAPDQAGRPDLSESAVLMPAFRGRMEPDMAFCGFPLNRAQLTAGGGWWFILEEQPTAPRFGLDVASGFGSDAPPLTEWNDLSWGHFAASAEELAGVAQLDPDRSPAGSPPPEPAWGAHAAAMAAILAQQPVRVSIHARDILPAQVLG